MISVRVKWCLGLAALATLAIGGWALVSASSQNSIADGQATPEFPTGQQSATALGMDPSRSGRVQATANVPADGMTPQTLSGFINPLWAISDTSLSAIRERPIFTPSRRKPAPVAPSLVQAPPSPIVDDAPRPLLTLIGATAGTAGGIAVFLNETNGIVRLKTGEGHAGWILSLVRGREATLQKGRATVTLAISNPPRQ